MSTIDMWADRGSKLSLFSFSTGSCGNCLYVSDGTEALLVDAGVGIRTVKRAALEYGLNMNALQGVLITHDHTDHVKAAGHLAKAYHLRVYATAKVHRGMAYTRTQAPVPRSQCQLIEPDTPFMLGHFHITPFALPHDASENVGYAISSAGETLVVMTDIGHITNNVRKYIAAADQLVIEADFDEDMLRKGPYPQQLKERITGGHGHLSNAQTAHILAEHWHPRLRTICLCHISEQNNRPELPYLSVSEALAETHGLHPGEDYQLIVLKRQVPTPVPPFYPRGLRAVLFDLDGTLINTEPQYSRVWKDIGERFLNPPLPTFHLDIKGTTLTQILNRYFPDPRLQRQIEEELDRFEANDMVFEYFDGAIDFVRSLRQQGIKTAIVTSSNRTKMEVVYRKLPHVRDLFDAILTSEDFAASKPAPDCFLAAARRLATPISQCAVFEDAFTGLEAGMRAGMLTIGLATSNSANDIAPRCHYVAQDWHHISYPQLCQLLDQHIGA